jgi:hypothetical protein
MRDDEPRPVWMREGEQKGSARGSVHWGCYYDTALDIEVDPHRCCFGSLQSDFALQAVAQRRQHSHPSRMSLLLPT